MFVPIFRSILITFALLAAAWAGVAWVRRRAKPYPHLVPLGLLFSVLLFIPACAGVACLHDAVVYREFHYDTPPGSVYGYRIPLPDSAMAVRVRTGFSGHQSSCSVTEPALAAWLRTLTVELRQSEESDDTPIRESLIEDARQRFKHTGWVLPDDLRQRWFKVLGANGASISVWYSRSTQTAYTDVNYW